MKFEMKWAVNTVNQITYHLNCTIILNKHLYERARTGKKL